MSPNGYLTLYCVLILIGALAGGYLPFFGHMTHGKLQIYLSTAAGVMLGASFFHVMPDAMELAGPAFGWFMALGAVGLFGIERFIAPHSHEMSKSNNQNHQHQHHDEHGCEHGHDHTEFAKTAEMVKEPHPAAPSVAGWAAVVGLTIHTFMNGFGLGGAVEADKAIAWPGFALFLAIVLHKPADALAISTVLSRKHVSGRTIALVQLGFALTVAAGVIAFHLALGSMFDEKLKDLVTGGALAFSAGTFLFIALSDLLPEVQFHRHDRIPLFLALSAGVILMGFLAWLEPHEHEGHNHAAPATHQHHEGDHDHDHDAHPERHDHAHG